MKALILLILGVLCLWPRDAIAQDPNFSQFLANSLYLNPSLTGFSPGTTIHTHYRNQWWNIRPKRNSFQTQSFSLACQLPDLESGFGFMYNGNIEGEGLLQWHNVGVSFAKIFPFNFKKDEKMLGDFSGDIRMGLSISRSWRSINWSQLVFTPQLNPITGIQNTNQVPSTYSDMTMTGYWDVNAGMSFRYDGWRVGFTANHINTPNQSILFPGRDISLPIRFTFHTSHIFEYDFIGNSTKTRLKGQIFPSIKWENQRLIGGSIDSTAFRYNSFSYGCAFALKPTAKPKKNQPKLAPYFGLWHHHRAIQTIGQNTNSLIILLGFENKNYKYSYNAGISYELNFSGLGSDTRGAGEISLTFNFPDHCIFKLKTDKRINVNRTCPVRP